MLEKDLAHLLTIFVRKHILSVFFLLWILKLWFFAGLLEEVSGCNLVSSEGEIEVWPDFSKLNVIVLGICLIHARNLILSKANIDLIKRCNADHTFHLNNVGLLVICVLQEVYHIVLES